MESSLEWERKKKHNEEEEKFKKSAKKELNGEKWK